MASNVIKGLTVEIGGDTTSLNKALKNVESKSRSLSKELSDVNRLLRFDPSNTELLTQKQQILSEAIASTKEKLETLREAEKQVQAQFQRGEISEEQVRALRREIEMTQKRLENYQKEAKGTADALEQMGSNSDKAAESIDEVSETSKDAEKSAKELGSSLDGTLADGLKAVTAAATAAIAAIVGCAESSREYRTEMGKLNTAFITNGLSSNAAKETYKELQSILGETDQAVEAANHLSKLVSSEENLSTWTEICTGIYAQFGASLPIEGLTEAANETAKVGQVTGPLADALNWAAKENERFGVTLKENTEQNEEWNKAVEEAESAEDFFNLALQECSNEQERQNLIMKTLSRQYSSAAEQYKNTNKEVIRANKANEEWNETLAEIGETVEPVVTDIKLFGTEMLKSAQKPIKEVASFVRNTFLPAMEDITDWASNNLPAISSGMVGITAALVAYKTATIATEVAQKGLKGAIAATEVAQKALNIATAASGWGLIAVAIAGVTAAFVSYSVQMASTSETVDFLTEEERELMEAVKETADAFKNQQEATQDNMSGIEAQMRHVTGLADELQTLADKSGEVQDADRARVDFILSELNSALGTEYEMVDGVIQKYDELVGSIEEVIEMKKANTLLEAFNADYVEAIVNEADSMSALETSYKDYQNQLQVTSQKREEYAEFASAVQQRLQDGYYRYNQNMSLQDQLRVSELEYAYRVEKETLDKKEADWTTAQENYGMYTDTIGRYEAAQTEALQGNYEKAVQILTDKNLSFAKSAEDIGQSSQEITETLHQEADNIGDEAARTNENFTTNMDGFTDQAVQEAETGYADITGAFSDSYSDSYSIGSDISDGLANGIAESSYRAINAARSVIEDAIAEARAAADSHSPSRKMEALGGDMDDGLVVGMEKKSRNILDAAKEQVQSLMEQYNPLRDLSAAMDAISRTEGRKYPQSTSTVNHNVHVSNTYSSPEKPSYAYLERLKRKERREILKSLKQP